MRIPSERPAGAPGQWWHLIGDAELEEGSLEVSINCLARSKVDERFDHLNATNYLDALTNVNHLLVAKGVIPKRLRYSTLHQVFMEEVEPEEPVRMHVKFGVNKHGLAFVADFRVEDRVVATIAGHAYPSVKKAKKA